jgi:hypothetical protein
VGQHLELLDQTFGRLDFEEGADAAGDFIEGALVGVEAEGELHAAFGTELIDEDAGSGETFEAFKEQCWAAGRYFGAAVEARLRDAIGNFGDFEQGRDFLADAAELAGFIEEFDPVSEVVEGQGGVSVVIRS